MNKNLKSNVKKHIPKDWLCEVRILYRLGKETFNDIIRTGWVNIVIITTMAAILMIFAACFRTAISISSSSIAFFIISNLSSFIFLILLSY